MRPETIGGQGVVLFLATLLVDHLVPDHESLFYAVPVVGSYLTAISMMGYAATFSGKQRV